ncbi:MAG: hypothetical protein INR71_06635 [Terriglobus roseus]|nr:hypothetical protein [Terriglobus roseus]
MLVPSLASLATARRPQIRPPKRPRHQHRPFCFFLASCSSGSEQQQQQQQQQQRQH